MRKPGGAPAPPLPFPQGEPSGSEARRAAWPPVLLRLPLNPSAARPATKPVRVFSW